MFVVFVSILPLHSLVSQLTFFRAAAGDYTGSVRMPTHGSVLPPARPSVRPPHPLEKWGVGKYVKLFFKHCI